MTELDPLNVGVILFIFILTYVGIISPKIDKTIAATFGAAISVIAILKLGIADPHLLESNMTEEALVHFQDLRIVALIFGTLIIVEVSQESGVFHFLSVKILKMTKGDPKKLLRYFGGLTLILSALVNNISAMMIVGSLTLIACERLELDPKPYIITELSMTTVGGIITLISSVPNIILSDLFNISFIGFIQVGAIWGVFCMFVNFLVFEYIYRNEIPKNTDPEGMASRVNEFDEWAAVQDKGLFYKSIAVLTVTIMGFVFSQQIGISMATIALTGGITIVLISGKKLDEVLAKLDWGLLAFFMGLFILVAALDAVQLLDYIAEWLTGVLPDNTLIAAIILLWAVALISAIIDNIVVAAAFGPILLLVATESGGRPDELLFAWATIFGANFGGGLTPIGAPSAVVGLAMLYRKTGEKMGWGEFIKTQGIATFLRLILTSGYLWILYTWVIPK